MKKRAETGQTAPVEFEVSAKSSPAQSRKRGGRSRIFGAKRGRGERKKIEYEYQDNPLWLKESPFPVRFLHKILPMLPDGERNVVASYAHLLWRRSPDDDPRRGSAVDILHFLAVLDQDSIEERIVLPTSDLSQVVLFHRKEGFPILR